MPTPDSSGTIYVKVSDYLANISEYTRSQASRVVVTDDQGEKIRQVVSLRGRPDPLLDTIDKAPMMRYETESDGSFLLMKERSFSPGSWDVQDKRDEVSFVYDMEGHVMVKHGSEDSMRKYMATFYDKQRQAGFSGRGLILLGMVTFRKGFPVEEINKVLSTSGYLHHILTTLEEEDNAERDPGLQDVREDGSPSSHG